LPPVGFGLVFHCLVADDALTSRLTHVHRQAAATGIPVAGAAIRGRSLPSMRRFDGARDGVFFVETGKSPLDTFVLDVAIELGILEGGALVVTATNEGEAGVHSLNETFHDRHVESSGREPMRGPLGRYFTAGVPVIFGRNDYRLGLFNGQLGRVVRTFEGERSLDVLFDGESEPRRLSGEHLIDLDLAYAVTCHKCQGSSAPRVIVPVYKSWVLDPSWLYTAVTRAERQVVMIGTQKVLDDTLALPFAAERRNVGLRWPGVPA
jgi:exodeoxyribonuclease V alpha subunit